LETDNKLRTSIEKDVQTKIKEMRTGKKVLDDDSLESVEAEIEAETAEASEIIADLK
jgi:hypothetical protein